MTSTQATVTDEWLVEQLDRTAGPGWGLSDSLSRLRSWCPGAHGARHEGFWVVTHRDDVDRVVQDWETFTSLPALSSPRVHHPVPDVADETDAPLRRALRRLVDDHPALVEAEALAAGARDIAARLLDGVVARGGCDFTGEFVRPYLGATLFGPVLDAPGDEIEWLAATAALATGADHPGAAQAWGEITTWLHGFGRAATARSARADGVHSLSLARVDRRSAARGEDVGVLQLLVLGWLETLGDALSHMMDQLCRHPLVLRQLRERPDLVPAAVDQLLRIDAATVSVARTVTRDVEIGGRRMVRGERVLACLPSAEGAAYRLSAGELAADTVGNGPGGRPGASGLAAHRCVRSVLARTNLRVALEVIVSRVVGVRLERAAQACYGSAFRRAAFSMPITFW